VGHPLKTYRDANQAFGSYATAGVVGNPFGTEVQRLVADYGNYQPFGHAGTDYPTPIGTPVYAISDGTVLWAGWAEDLPGTGDIRAWLLYAYFPGIVTVIQHSWGISLTAHMSDAPLNVGDVVKEGQQIGLTGNTKARGQTVGAHVHIEALVDLSYRTQGDMIYGRVNPERFYGTLTNTGEITQEDELADYAGTLGAIINAVARMETKINAINDRVFGRDVQRWYNPKTLEVKTESFPGGVAARSADVHDIISTNNLIEASTNKILTALSGQPGIDSAVIAGLREQLAAELKEATANLSITLEVKDEAK
jgi:hypothetical protein